MIEFNLNVTGNERVQQGFAYVERGMRSMEPLWVLYTALFRRLMAHQFATQGQHSGGWEELSDRYAARKDKQGKPIGVRTGRLRDSYVMGNDDSVRMASATSLTLTTKVPYAEHFSKSGKNQRRPIVGLTPDDEVQFQNLGEAFLEDLVIKSRLLDDR